MAKWYSLIDDPQHSIYIQYVIGYDPAGFWPDGMYQLCPPEYEESINQLDAVHKGAVYHRPKFGIPFTFNIETKDWEINQTEAFQNAKKNAITAIDAKTQRLIENGFEFSSKRFSMSEAAQRNWIALSSGLANDMLPFPMTVSTVDESAHILNSANNLKAFLAAYLTYQADPSQPLGTGRALKERVSAATSVEEVEAIVDDRE